jgi:hypothetical protein
MVMRGNTVGWEDVELVLGAIVYDFGRRDNAIYPDAELGRQALRAAEEGVFPLGRRGAGRSVTVVKTFGLEQGEFSGQGGAFREVGPTKVAVFTVVNAFGAIVDREGTVVRGHYDADRDLRSPLVDALERSCHRRRREHDAHARRHKSAANAARLRQLGVRFTPRWRARSSPSTRSSTVTCSTVSTNEVENPELTSMSLSVVASELAWDAVLSCVGDEPAASTG